MNVCSRHVSRSRNTDNSPYLTLGWRFNQLKHFKGSQRIFLNATELVKARVCSKTNATELVMARVFSKTNAGSDTLSGTQSYEWHRRLREGRESIEDGRSSVCPQTFRRVENTEKVLKRYILAKDLYMHRVCQHLVPHMLIKRPKQQSNRNDEEAKSRLLVTLLYIYQVGLNNRIQVPINQEVSWSKYLKIILISRHRAKRSRV
ncbi:hypothetical protein TNCV_3214731 [Trichonephila clavipes]|nr:hypothetical protein TNCV_3214731 [Trichonephila clavipes]